MLRKLTLGLLGLLALGLSLILTIPRVTAHAEYDHSDPAADAVLTVAPAQVQIWFTQELFRRKGLNKLEVYDASEQRVDLDDATIDDDDRTLLRVSLAPALGDGRYIVRWQATSAEDGHEAQGEFSFTVGAAMTTTSSAPTITTTTSITASITASSTASSTVTAAPLTATPAQATAAAPITTPTPVPTSGFSCFGSAMPFLLVVGVLFVPRRRRLGE